MLDRRHDARRLRPQNRLCPHDARQKRVFRNIFEVTAVPRIADEVDTAAQQDIEPFGARFAGRQKIGRASCRERGCQYVSISVSAVTFKKKKTRLTSSIMD